MPLRGSVLLLFALSAVYLLTTLGLGLFVSTISRTQQQAMMTTTFFFLMPMVFLSGFIFPIENMPAAIQPVTYLIPLRYFLVILRSIFLKASGWRRSGRRRSRCWRGAWAFSRSRLRGRRSGRHEGRYTDFTRRKRPGNPQRIASSRDASAGSSHSRPAPGIEPEPSGSTRPSRPPGSPENRRRAA